MAKFIFIVPPLTGHVNPTLSLGKGLIDKGHEVAWVSFDPSLEKKLPQKGKLLLIPIQMSEAEKEKLKEYMVETSKKAVYGIDSLKFLYDEVLIPMNTYILEGIEKIIEEYKPDIVITDHQLFAGAVAAIRKKVPYVTSVTAPASIKVSDNLPMIHEWEGEQIIAFQKKFGIEGDKRLDSSSLLTLVYTSKEFFGKTDLPDNYKFIGPVITENRDKIEFDWNQLQTATEDKKILVSIGTTFDHTQKIQFFTKVLEAFKDQNIKVVMVSEPELFETIPDNFIIKEKVPQLELLSEMDAVICHGGHNTVCETLLQGIPLVVLPIAYDQSYVAGCVTDSNAGIRLKFNRFKAENLKEATYKILQESEYKQAAEKVKKSFKEAGGISSGVDHLERLLKEN